MTVRQWQTAVEASVRFDELESARGRVAAYELRLAEVRAAIVEAGERGVRWGDLRMRLAPRLIALIDAPLTSPAAAGSPTVAAGDPTGLGPCI